MGSSKPAPNGFGSLLKQLRLEEQMTLAAFAAKLGISAANLCDFERGRKHPSPRKALEFGRCLHLPEELMIELSLEGAMAREQLVYSVSVRQGATAPADPLPSDFEILVVEDNPRDLELMLRAFEKNDVNRAHLRVFRDGGAVLDYLLPLDAARRRRSNPPKLLLLDLDLPKFSGIEVARRLKTNPDTCGIPIVVFTASTAEATLVEGYRLGVNGYLVKPTRFEEFSAAIGALGKYWVGVNRTPGSAPRKGSRGRLPS